MIQAGMWQGTCTELCKKTVWYGYETEVWWEALFSSLLKLLLDIVNHWSIQAPPAPPTHLKMWYLFLQHSRGCSCGAVPYYSSVTCCLWALDEQWVSADRVRWDLKDVTEQFRYCKAAAIFHQSPYFSVLPSLLFSAFPHAWNHLTDILMHMFQW